MCGGHCVCRASPYACILMFLFTRDVSEWGWVPLSVVVRLRNGDWCYDQGRLFCLFSLLYLWMGCVWERGGVSLLVLSLSASASSAVSTCRLLIGRSSSQSLMDGAWFLPSKYKTTWLSLTEAFCEQADDGFLLDLQQPHLDLLWCSFVGVDRHFSSQFSPVLWLVREGSLCCLFSFFQLQVSFHP